MCFVRSSTCAYTFWGCFDMITRLFSQSILASSFAFWMSLTIQSSASSSLLPPWSAAAVVSQVRGGSRSTARTIDWSKFAPTSNMPPRKKAKTADTTASVEQCELKVREGQPDVLRMGLIKMWREGTMCDVELSVGDRTFHAHRNVLGATSEYFKAALCGDTFAESTAAVVKIPDVSAAAFEHVLEFVYVQTCRMPLALLQEVLEASCRLQCTALQAAAEDALIAHLSPSSCLDAWDFADHFSLTPLAVAAKKTALKAFEEVAASSAFNQMPATRLEELLADDTLAAKEEETAFTALEAWFRAQATPPESSVTERLLSHVRFPLMKLETRKTLETSPLVQRHPMVLVSAYREEMLQEATARTRLRSAVGSGLAFCQLNVGMRVQVMADRNFVQTQCEQSAPGSDKPVNWAAEMESALGKVYAIVRINRRCQAAVLATSADDGMHSDFHFPFTVLLRAD